MSLPHVVLRVRRQKKAVEDASLLVVLLTNAISMYIANDGQSLAKAVSTKHKKLKIMLKSRCLQKTQVCRLGEGGSQGR